MFRQKSLEKWEKIINHQPVHVGKETSHPPGWGLSSKLNLNSEPWGRFPYPTCTLMIDLLHSTKS